MSRRLAEGVYRYRCDGKLLDIVEPWAFDQQDAHLSLHSQRCVDGKPVLRVHADFHASRCTAMRADWQGDGAARSIRYEQSRTAAPKWCWQQISDTPSPPEHVLAESHALLFPLMRAAAGPLVLNLAQAEQTVLVPSLHDPHSAEFLHPRLTQRHAVHQGDGHYRYYGGEYGDSGSDYWLRSDGLLQAYRWESAQGVWEVELDELERQPDFPAFLPPSTAETG